MTAAETPRTLISLPGRWAICRLAADAAIPEWAWNGSFASVTRTPSELSIVCDEAVVPEGFLAERGWRMFSVAGSMDLAIVGVLASIAGPLARGGVSLFAVSTFDTDFILVREHDAEKAGELLCEAGFDLSDER